MTDAGYTPVPNWLILNPRMTPTHLRVFLVLAMHADNDSHECWPSQATIAREADCSRDTVQRSLQVLRGEGAVTWTRRRGTNVYRVVVGQGAPLRSRTHAAPDAAPVRPEKPHPCGTELDPGNYTQELPAAAAADGALFDVEQPQKQEPEPTARDLVAVWCERYQQSQAAKPHQAVVRRIAGQARQVARDCTTTDDWRTAWRAFRDAGLAGEPFYTRHLVAAADARPARPHVARPDEVYDPSVLDSLPPPPKRDLYG